MSNKTLLVVEDDPDIADTIARLFDRRGYLVLTACDGAEALDLIAARRPDAVILDIDLPKVDGWQVCRIVKKHPLTRLTPIVLVTAAHPTREAAEVGLELGADEFVEKPFHGILLVHAVERLLARNAQEIRPI
jgi:DNA-binding response OmpR family regulator